MKFRRRLFPAALAILLAAIPGVAVAQGFGSVSSGSPLPDAATATPTEPAAGPAAPAEPRASDAAPAGCAPPNPFLTGTAAAEAEKRCLALNPFLSGSGAPATATATDASPASAGVAAGTTVPFGGPSADAAGPPMPELADRVLVKKSERRLYLLRSDRVIADYPIKLGLSPKGPKQREGDYRTPEGSYQIVSRNARSDFFLSLEVSYPNAADLERAKELGVRPGGLIMIHGQPNTPRKPPGWYARNDWTDGCIAVSNSDMVDIWLRTAVGVPIEIRP